MEYNIYKSCMVKPGRLPAGYTELEYIQSSGIQYIDTGIDGTNRTAVWTTTVENLSSGAQKALISSGYAQTVRNAYGTFIYNNTWSASGNNLGEVIATGKQNIVSTTIINTSGNTSTTIVVDGVQSSIVERDYAASHNMNNTTLFASKVDASTMTSGGNFKLYSATCVLDGVLVRNFIPAKNNSNVLGMYDLVTNQFFTNQGTGDFIAGPEASGFEEIEVMKRCMVNGESILPSGYTELEYIESSGTQYIDTGITAKATQGIHIKFAYMSTENETSPMSASYSTSHNVIQYYNGNNNIYMGSVTTSYDKPGTQVNTIYDLWINQDINNPSAVLNGETLTLSSGKSNTWATINVNWGLFARNNNGTFTGKKVKIYEEQINDNNTIVQHLIPAKRISDSVLGMYDLISKQFFTNQGTGDFIAGPEVQRQTEYTIYKQEVLDS